MAILRAKPLFSSFDYEHIKHNLLPAESISYRNRPENHVKTQTLTKEIENVLEQLRMGKRTFAQFTILKDREFNYKEFSGVIILKFNNYPFVLKMFIENPYSFLHPEQKGFRHGCMAKMAGGLNRYLAGLKRIQNLENAREIIKNMEDLPIELDFPRKWFWLPNNVRWFDLNGTHFKKSEKTFHVRLPEIYAIVADEIICNKKVSAIKKMYGKRIFKLCQKVKFNIDPNMKNFRLEDGTEKLVLIDTEHFPSVLGFKEEIKADNYFALHIKMGIKAIYDCWLS